MSSTFRVAESMIECLSVDDTIKCFDVVKQGNSYLIALGIESGEIILWKYSDSLHHGGGGTGDGTQNKDFSRIFNHESACDCIKFSENSLYLASCSEKRGLVVADSVSNMILFDRNTANRVTYFEWAKHNQLLLIGDEAGNCLIFDMNKGDISFQFVSHSGESPFCLFSVNFCLISSCFLGSISSLLVREGRLIAIAGKERDSYCIKLWELECLDF